MRSGYGLEGNDRLQGSLGLPPPTDLPEGTAPEDIANPYKEGEPRFESVETLAGSITLKALKSVLAGAGIAGSAARVVPPPGVEPIIGQPVPPRPNNEPLIYPADEPRGLGVSIYPAAPPNGPQILVTPGLLIPPLAAGGFVQTILGEAYDNLVYAKNSWILGENLDARERLSNPDFVRRPGDEAHHIYPFALSKFPGLGALRERLIKLGIDLNGADNGVYLPGNKSTDRNDPRAYYERLHNDDYAKAIVRDFRYVSNQQEFNDAARGVRVNSITAPMTEQGLGFLNEHDL